MLRQCIAESNRVLVALDWSGLPGLSVMVSDEALVMRRPAEVYARLALAADGRGVWTAVRRPLFGLFVIGCVLSLVVTGRLTARLVAGGAAGWIVVPLFEALSFALVRRRGRSVPFSRDLDLFLRGNGPWWLWLILLGTGAALVTPLEAYSWWATALGLVCAGVTAGAVALWCAYIDYCFYRVVMDRSPGAAVYDLLLQRALCWTAVALYAFGYAAWPIAADFLGL